MLDVLAGLTTLLFIAAGFAVGLRLLALGHRSRGLPELSLGLGMFLIVGVGLPLQLTGRALVLGEAPELAGRTLLATSALLMNSGWAAVWVFTWKVFRPESAVAKATVHAALLALLALAGLALARLFATEPQAPGSASFSTLATVLLAQLLYVWTAVEALRYWRMMRRRVAHGLADPVVANRFLLWGLVAVASLVTLAAPLFFALAGSDYNESAAGRLVTATSGLGCAAFLWLAFLPPAAYLRRVRLGAVG